MAKTSKHRSGQRPRFARTDIPYADRMLMEQYRTTAAQRDDAAAKALKLALIALNNSEGMGYVRLARFADAFRSVCDEYYSERMEVGDAHIDARLEQLGFLVRDGHVYVVEDDEGKITGKGFLTEKLVKLGGNPTQEDLDKLGITAAQAQKIMEVNHAE